MPDGPNADSPAPQTPSISGSARRFVVRHVASIIAFTLVLATAAFSFVTLRQVITSQEHRLLDERATEVVAALESSTRETTSALATLGAAVMVGGAQSPLFTGTAAALTSAGNTVGVASAKDGSFRVIASAGKDAAATGSALTDVRAELARRATSSSGLVSAVVTGTAGSTVLLAIHVASPTPAVAYLEEHLNPGVPITRTPKSAYRELDAELYAASTPDPKALLLTTGGLRPSAHTVHRVLPVGQDNWLIVLQAHDPLVGSFAVNVPWLLAGVAVVLGLLVVILLEVLGRRREYAMRLVEQRTRALADAQAVAEAANRSKSEFLSRMSHELRTPLNAVLGFSQLLELDDLSDDQRQSVNQITKGGRHLLDLINEILDITQIETGQLSMSPEAVLVGDVLADATELVRPLAEERSVHLINGNGPDCAQYIFVDRQRVKQVMLNLLGNGIKYNRHGGSVSLGCAEVSPGTMRISVTDTGPGIAKEHFDLLFTPFERLGAVQSNVEGTGIGLALSKRLVEAMGGALGVESTVGRGSTFWVDFPIVEGPVERIERLDVLAADEPLPEPIEAGPTILHIEDNLSNIRLVERVLAQRPGVRLISAMQAGLGMELARQHRPVLILLDLNLADLPGEEALQRLRDDPSTANVPVVIVSADAMPRQVQRLLAGGAAAYLTKPIDVRELLRLVDGALAGRTRSVTAAGAPDGTSG